MHSKRLKADGKPTITDRNAQQARRFAIRGRVQGVWFRDSTRREAEALGLGGYAKNLPDGSVEVLAVGNPESLDTLRRWLAKGPPLAKVTEVIESEAEYRELTAFEIG